MATRPPNLSFLNDAAAEPAVRPGTRRAAPRPRAGRIIDQALCYLLLLYVSHAWVYAGDFQTQADTTAPFLFEFGIAAQLIGLYGLVRLRFTKLLTLSVTNPFFLVMLAWGGASIAWSTDSYNSFGMLRAMLLVLFGCMYFSQALSAQELHRCVRVFMLAVLGGSILLALFTPYGSAGGVHVGAWRGLYGHKNGLGEAAAIGLIVGVASITALRRWSRLDIALIAASAICCVFSGSANAIGASIVGLGITIAASTSRRLSSFYIVNRVAFLVVMVAGGVLAAIGVHYVVQTLGRDLTFTGRTIIWKVYLSFTESRPWIGWGWTTSSSNAMFVQVLRDETGLKYIRSAHSAYVTLLVELGWIGCGLYATWLVAALLRAIGAVTRVRDPLATVQMGVILGMATFGTFEASAGFIPSMWVFIALAYGYAYQTQRRNPVVRAGPRVVRVPPPGTAPPANVAASPTA